MKKVLIMDLEKIIMLFIWTEVQVQVITYTYYIVIDILDYTNTTFIMYCSNNITFISIINKSYSRKLTIRTIIFISYKTNYSLINVFYFN